MPLTARRTIGTDRVTLSPATDDVDNVLIPQLGRYRLADLNAQLLRTVFTQIAVTTNTKGRPQSASAMQHLRAALNLAVREGLLECNPARHIEITGYQQPTRKCGPTRGSALGADR